MSLGCAGQLTDTTDPARQSIFCGCTDQAQLDACITTYAADSSTTCSLDADDSNGYCKVGTSRTASCDGPYEDSNGNALGASYANALYSLHECTDDTGCTTAVAAKCDTSATLSVCVACDDDLQCEGVLDKTQCSGGVCVEDPWAGGNRTVHIPFGPNDEYHMVCTVAIDNTTGTPNVEGASGCSIVMSPVPTGR